MSRCSCAVAFAALSFLWSDVSAIADVLRCQSVNGNLNCAGSSGASCQTVNGKSVCTSGHGDIVQSFGGTAAPEVPSDIGKDAIEQELNDPALVPAMDGRPEQHRSGGHAVMPNAKKRIHQSLTDGSSSEQH